VPRKIITHDGMSFEYREYELPALAATEVRVRVEFAAPKHGTERHGIEGSSFNRKIWDSDLRMYLPKVEDDQDPSWASGERGIGNMVVGTVTEVGGEATRYRPGDRVFGYGQICEEHQQPEDRWWPLGNLSPDDAVCVDPAHVAFVAVRDGHIRLGDTVAVFGLGAIGLCAVQLARAGGARKVFAVDPIAIRREFAQGHGADAAFDPVAVDAALQIKQATERHGVDVSMETSGNGRALHEAIRCIRQCGTIVHVPWGPHDCSALHLDEEFHLNRPTIIGSQAWEGWGNPDRDHPLWNPTRAFEATLELFRAGLVTGKGILHPVVPFDEAPEALKAIFVQPETTIKVGVTVAD